MAFDVGSLVAHLKLDQKDFEVGIEKAKGALSKMGDVAKWTAAGVAALAAAGTAAAAGLFKLAENAGATGDAYAKMSQRIGISVETLSALDHAASLSDVSLSSVAKGVKNLAVLALNAQQGMASATLAFSSLNMSATNTDGTLRSTNELFFEAADRISKLTNETQKVALAQELFGRAGMEMIPLLNEGGEGIQRLMENSKRLGLTWDTLSAKQAEAFMDSLDDLKGSIKGVGDSIGKSLMPYMTPIIQGMTDWIAKNRELIAEKVVEWLKLTGNGFKNLFELLKEAKPVLDKTVTALLSMGTVLRDNLKYLMAENARDIAHTAELEARFHEQVLQNIIDRSQKEIDAYSKLFDYYTTLAENYKKQFSSLNAAQKTHYDELIVTGNKYRDIVDREKESLIEDVEEQKKLWREALIKAKEYNDKATEYTQERIDLNNNEIDNLKNWNSYLDDAAESEKARNEDLYAWKEEEYEEYFANYVDYMYGQYKYIEDIENQQVENHSRYLSRIENDDKQYSRGVQSIYSTIQGNISRTLSIALLDHKNWSKTMASVWVSLVDAIIDKIAEWIAELLTLKAILESMKWFFIAFAGIGPDAFLPDNVAAPFAHTGAASISPFQHGGIVTTTPTILPLKAVSETFEPEVTAPLSEFPRLFQEAFGGAKGGVNINIGTISGHEEDIAVEIGRRVKDAMWAFVG